jgi:hypothetical protein
MSGAVSHRKLHTFIRIRFALLSRAFPSRMRKLPSYTQLREILVGLNKDDLEAAFRQHAGALATPTGDAAIAADAKALRGSFDAVDDRNAALVLSLFVAGERIILAHRTVDEKSNEIPGLQALIAELGLQGIAQPRLTGYETEGQAADDAGAYPGLAFWSRSCVNSGYEPTPGSDCNSPQG